MAVRVTGGGRGRGRPAMAEINVTPLVDVMLVLLIISMVAAPMLQEGIPLELPASETATTIEEIERAVGKKVPKANALRQLSDEERAPIEAAVLERVRASMRKVYIANLTAQAKQAVQAGLDEGHPFVRAYATAIERIKKLGPR